MAKKKKISFPKIIYTCRFVPSKTKFWLPQRVTVGTRFTSHVRFQLWTTNGNLHHFAPRYIVTVVLGSKTIQYTSTHFLLRGEKKKKKVQGTEKWTVFSLFKDNWSILRERQYCTDWCLFDVTLCTRQICRTCKVIQQIQRRFRDVWKKKKNTRYVKRVGGYYSVQLPDVGKLLKEQTEKKTKLLRNLVNCNMKVKKWYEFSDNV